MAQVRQVIPFTTEEAWRAERSKDLTSTDIAALFGVSPYRTAFELYHVKHGNIAESTEENERTRWGKRLQDAIAQGVASEQGWAHRRMDEYVRDPELHIASSFDFRRLSAYTLADMVRAEELEDWYLKDAESDVLIEVKNVDSLAFRNGWVTTDFGLEAPAHIELQMQHQLGVSGLREGYIAALVGGNRVELLRREFDAVIWQRILDLAAWFWSLKQAPAPDYARDYEVISRLHGYSCAGKVIEATPEVATLMAEYRAAAADYSDAERRKKVAKAKILERIGEAERVESPEFVISAKQVQPCEIAAYTRDGFRGFRINERSSK